jgi:hypothetical protein
MHNAGASARIPFRDAARVAKEHGGNAADWVKKSSSSHTARDGAKRWLGFFGHETGLR